MSDILSKQGLLGRKSQVKQINLDFANQRKQQELEQYEARLALREAENRKIDNYNKDAWTQVDELDTALGSFKQLGANLATGVAETAGNIAATPIALQSAGLALTPDTAIDAYNTVKQFEKIGGERTTAVDAAYELLDREIQADTQGIPVGGTAGMAMDLGYAGKETVRDKVERATKSAPLGTKIKAAFTDITEGTVQRYNADITDAEMGAEIDEGVNQFRQGGKDFADGNLGAAFVNMFAGAKEIVKSGGTLLSDPLTAAGYIAESIPDIVAGRVSTSLLALSSMGYSTDVLVEGLQEFEKREGRLPTQTEAAKIVAASASAGAADFVADKTLGKALSPTGEKSIAGSLKRIGAATTTEFATEAYQTLTEEALASLKDVTQEDVVQALKGGVIGSFVGGSLATVGETGQVVRSSKEAFEVAKEATTLDRKGVKKAVETGDFSELDDKPTSKITAIIRRNQKVDDKNEMKANFIEMNGIITKEIEAEEQLRAQYMAMDNKESKEAKNLLKAVEAKQKSVFKLNESINQEKQRLVDKFSDPKTRQETVNKAIAGDAEAAQVVLGSFDISNDILTTEQAEALAKTENVTPVQAAQLNNYASYNRTRDTLATLPEVNQMVIHGGTDKEGNSYIGANQYINMVNNAISKNDLESATKLQQQLEAFTIRHTLKATAYDEAYRKGRNSPEYTAVQDLYKLDADSFKLQEALREEAKFLQETNTNIKALLDVATGEPKQATTQDIPDIGDITLADVENGLKSGLIDETEAKRLTDLINQAERQPIKRKKVDRRNVPKTPQPEGKDLPEPVPAVVDEPLDVKTQEVNTLLEGELTASEVEVNKIITELGPTNTPEAIALLVLADAMNKPINNLEGLEWSDLVDGFLDQTITEGTKNEAGNTTPTVEEVTQESTGSVEETPTTTPEPKYRVPTQVASKLQDQVSKLDRQINTYSTEAALDVFSQAMLKDTQKYIDKYKKLKQTDIVKNDIAKLEKALAEDTLIPESVVKREQKRVVAKLNRQRTYLQKQLDGQIRLSSYNVIDQLSNDTNLPLNEQNLVVNNMAANPKPNILNQTDNWDSLIEDYDLLDKAFGDETDAAVYTLMEFNKLNDKVRQSANSIFKPKEANRQAFRHEDWTQFLTNENGELLDHVMPAITSGIWDWLVSNARGSLFNDYETIAKLLSEDDDFTPSKEQRELLKEAGVLDQLVFKDVGQSIAKSLQVRGTGEGYNYADSKFAQSLGTFAGMVMLDLGLVTQKEIPTNLLGGDKFNADSDATIAFIKADTNKVALEEGRYEVSDEINEIIAADSNYKDFTDKVFGLERRVKYPSLKPIESVVDKLKGSFQNVSKKAQEILKKHQNKPNYIKKDQFKVFDFLGKDAQREINGYVTEEDMGNLMVADRDGAVGKNLDIDRAIDNFYDFTGNVLKGDLDKPFYLKHSIWKNLRIGIESIIDPQGNKVHRSLMMQENWENTIDRSNPKHMAGFFLAVAEGMDLDVDKRKPDTAIQKLQDLINKPEMVEAIGYVQQILNNSADIDQSAATAAIVKATKMGKMKTHSLDALVGLAMYQNAVDSDSPTFKANLFREIDGITNGVAIASLMFAEGDTMADRIERLHRMGFGFDNEDYDFAEFSEAGNQDTYQALVPIWQKAIKTFIQNRPDIDNDRIILQTIVGMIGNADLLSNVVEELTISKDERTEVKYPLMVIIYGSSDSSVERAVGNAFIDNVYSQLSKLQDEYNQTLRELSKQQVNNREDVLAQDAAKKVVIDKIVLAFKNLEIVLGRKVSIPTEVGSLRGRFNLKQFEFTTPDKNVIVERVAELYGKPLTESIHANYSSLIQNRVKVNKAASAAFKAFERIYNNEVSKAIQAKKDAGEWIDGISDLTKEEYDSIRDSLKEVMPIVDNFWSKESNDINDGTYLGKIKNEVAYSEYKEVQRKNKVAKEANHKSNPLYVQVALNKRVGNTQRKRKTSYGNKVVYDDVGVSPTVLQVQGIDGSTMLKNYDTNNIWGIHDAIATSILDAEKAGQQMNVDFKDVIENQDILAQSLTMFERAMRFAGNYDQENGTNYISEVGDSLRGSMKSMAFQEEDWEQLSKLKTMKGEQILDLFYGELAMVSNQTTAKKKETTDRITTWDQYHMTGAEYNVSGEANTNHDAAITQLLETVSNRPRSSSEIEAGSVEGSTLNQSEVTQAIAGTKFDVSSISDSTGRRGIVGLFYREGIEISEKIATEIYNARQQGPFKDLSDMVKRTKGLGPKFLEKNSDILYSTPNNLRGFTWDNRGEVSNMNTLQVFDELNATSHITESAEHLEHLRGLVENTINQVVEPFNMYLAESDAVETFGATTIADMYIVNQAVKQGQPQSGMLVNGIRMSTPEVFTHELVHNVTYYALRQNPQLRRLARRMWAVTKSKLDYTAFMNPLEANDPNYEFEVQAAKQRYDYIFNTSGNTKYLDEFIAHAVTNANFMNALSKITATPATTKLRSLSWLDRINEVYSRILDFVFGKITHVKPDEAADAQLMDLMVALSKAEGRKKRNIIRKTEAAYGYALDQVNGVLNKANRAAFKIAGKAFSKDSRFSVVRAAGRTARLFGDDNVDFLTDKVQQFSDNIITESNEYTKAINSVLTEGKGRTDKNGMLHDIKRVFNVKIDQLRKRTMQLEKQNILNAFKSELNKTEQVTLTQLMQLDFSDLVSKNGFSEAVEYVKNDEARVNKIKEIQDTLFDEFPDEAQFYKNHAINLAHFMIYEKGVLPTGVLKNSHNIARLFGTSLVQPTTDLDRRESLIDELTSLYALQVLHGEGGGLSKLNPIRNLIAKDSNGVEYIMNMHTAFKENSFKELEPVHKVKGFISDIVNQDIAFRVGTKEDQQKFEDEGYELLNVHPLNQDPLYKGNKTPMYAYVAKDGGMARYNAGMINLMDTKSRGTDLFDIRMNASDNAPKKHTHMDLKNIKATKTKAFDKTMGKVTFLDVMDNDTFLSPIFNPSGDAVNYAYLMNAQTKNSILERDLRITEVLPKMIADLNAKPNIRKNNQVVTEALYDQWVNEDPAKQKKYVEISPNSSDPKLRETWYMLPEDMRKHTLATWGRNSLMVSRDTFDLAFGYRKYSITEIINKDPEARNAFEKFLNFMVLQWFGKKTADRLRRVKNTENVIQELVSMGKDIWVIKSFFVTLTNTVSNIMLLRMRGVPVTKALIDYSRAVKGASDYKKYIKEESALVSQLDNDPSLSGRKRRKLEQRLGEVRAELEANPVKALIDNGALQTIVEDVDIEDDADKVIKGYFNKLSDKYTKRVPQGIKTAAKTALLMQGSKPYDFLRDMAQMSDFGARFALYNHVKSRKEDPMTSEQAVGHVMDIFIDYDLPTHKMIQYGNDMGFLFFTKYLIRVIKILYTTLRDYPAQVLSLLLLQNYFGDVTDIYDTGLNPLSRIGTVMDFVDAPADIATVHAVMSM